MIAAPAANAADNVTICHATGSESKPYIVNSVDPSSTDLSGHRGHITSPQTWSSGTWWNGTWHPAGSPKPDLIPGVNFVGTITEAYCAAKGTGAIEVTPSVTWTDPSCANNNTASWAGTNTDKVTYAVSGTVAPSESVLVSATAKAGYAFPRRAQTDFPNTFGAAQDCRGTVTPQNPTVVQPGCTGPGTSSALSVATATTAGVGYSYNATDMVVTATAAEGKKFGTLPTGWSSVSDTVATYRVSLVPAGDCLVSVPAVEPSASGNSCTTPGHLVLPSTAGDGYHWTGDTSDTPGDHTVTAVADTGYELTGTVTWTVHVKGAGEGLDCTDPATEVTPLAPTWSEADCDDAASVTYRPVTGVAYDTTGTVAPKETATVTASLVGNHVFADGVETEWSHTFDPRPTDCDETVDVVMPRYPTARAATCFVDGTLRVPAQPAGVLMRQSGSAPGDVRFTFALAEGYAFPEGTDTEVVVTVASQKSGSDCLLGEEETRPKPKPRERGPVVLGSQAAVPTAVAAGVAGLPTTSVSSSSSPQLAQALVAGGLLMLVAGGSMGLGRRPRGAHES